MISSRSIKALQHVQLGLLHALEKFLALEVLAQELFRFRHLLVDLDVGDDLVVDHGGDAVGETAGRAGGGNEAKSHRRPHKQVDSDE